MTVHKFISFYFRPFIYQLLCHKKEHNFYKNKIFINVLSVLFILFATIPIFTKNETVYANQTNITPQVNIELSENTIPAKNLKNHTLQTKEIVLNNANTAKQNTTNFGYTTYIDDSADLLSSAEEQKLEKTMQAICNYGHVVFVSISENPYHNTKKFAKSYYDNLLGDVSGVIFLVDMDERYLHIYSNGTIYKTVTNAYANTITDNVYAYASDGDYFNCANEAFKQMLTLLEGHKIAQPMKYISNALLALAFALMINYFIVMSYSKKRKASNKELLDGIYSHVEIKHPNTKFLHQTRRHVPRNPPPSSGGKTGSSGGHSSGGSHGGGGGHRF